MTGPALAFTLACLTARPAGAESYCDLVDPFIGTEGGGNTYPGAQVPWGMVSVSPHTDLTAPSGYIHGRKYLYGLGHVQISGAGCSDLGNIVLMATIGPTACDPDKYRSQIDNERAAPGFYRVDLSTWGATFEATATERAGFTRITFPARPNGDANLLFDMGARLSPDPDGGASPYLGAVWVVSTTELAGWSESGGFCGSGSRQRVHFAAVLSKRADAARVWSDGALLNSGEASGRRVGALMSWATSKSEAILVKVGISYVSIENARANLAAELPDWDFAGARLRARAAWEKELSRVRAEGGTADQRKTFYTALYHMLIHPNIASDVNGEYQGFRGSGPRQIAGRAQYSVFSLWDTYRTVHPFLTLVYPARQLEMVQSMLEMAADGGWLPKWELAGNETGVMVGDPGTIVVADAALKRLKGLDRDAAWAAVRRNSTATPNPVRPGFDALLSHGYIPEDDPAAGPVWGSVSTTLEYALADWHASRLALDLGKAEAEPLLERSRNYRNLFDAGTGFLRPRNRDGSWLSPFDPAVNQTGSGGPGYVEGNAWQYTFFVPHDVPGLIALYGDQDAFTEKLQECVDSGHFALWNEPDFAWAYLFDYADGEAWRTQRLVREFLASSFKPLPGGLPGNDDAGATSGWIVWSMLGLYPVCPGSGDYEIGSPVFDTVTVALDPAFWPAKAFTIRAGRNGPLHPYLQWATLNGRPSNTPHLRFEDLVNGAAFSCEMGPLRGTWGGTPRTPVIRDQPRETKAVEGSPSRFSIRAGGTGPLEYQWRHNGQDIPGAVRRQLDLPATPLAATGAVFTCVVHSPFGGIESRGATLFVEPDRTAPAAVSALLQPATAANPVPVVIVGFSEPVEAAGAETPANYAFYPPLSVRNLKLARDGRSVTLELSAAPPSNRTCRVDVKNVRDRATKANVMAPARLTVLPEGDGLRAEYFDRMDLSGHSIRRIDPEINFNWGENSPDPAVPPDKFSVRWKAKVRPEETGVWTFYTFTDDGVRLWIDGKKIVNEWHDMRPGEHSGTVYLESGRLYEVWMEYFENTYTAQADLRWSGPNSPKAIVPRRNLYSK
jgi:predicted alpha-1,2-mannosidase